MNNPKNRIIAITDLHGNTEKLKTRLYKCNLNTEKDILVFNGDVIDKGTYRDQLQVIDTLLELEHTMKDRFIWILGNHEDSLINEYNRLSEKDRKVHFSDEQLQIVRKISRRDFPLYKEFENFVFVHAGFGFSEDMNVRNSYIMDNSVITGRRSYTGKLAIVGHKVVRTPLLFDGKGNVREIKSGEALPLTGTLFFDTGCGYGFELTVIVIENNRISFLCV